MPKNRALILQFAYKLVAFNKDKSTDCQMLIPIALFTESSLNGNSTPPLDAIEHTLSTLRKFSKSLTYLPKSAHSTYMLSMTN